MEEEQIKFFSVCQTIMTDIKASYKIFVKEGNQPDLFFENLERALEWYNEKEKKYEKWSEELTK